MADIQFTARRLSSDGRSIISRWFDMRGQPLCYCLEPGRLSAPHPCIPVGDYNLQLRTIGQKHQDYNRHYTAKFGAGWHRGMVEIVNVPGREAIEFHVGNTIADTLGCCLAGTAALPPPGNGSGHWEVSGSRAAYERVYPILRDAIVAGPTLLRVLSIGALA